MYSYTVSGIRPLLTLLIVLLFCTANAADDPFAKTSSNLNASLLAAQDEFLPVDEAYRWSYTLQGQTLVLDWQIADGYYLYEERFKFETQNSGQVLTPVYSQGKMKFDELFDRETMVHHHLATATFDLAALPEDFILKVEYQGCAEAGLCYPPQKHRLRVNKEAQELSIADNTETSKIEPADNLVALPPEIEAAANTGWLIQAILFAILGGVILNLMPCVFPVLSIKIMSLAAADRSRLTLHGWAYTAGIIVCFVVFAATLLAGRAGGEAIGWGFQLQSPGLIAALAYLFFVMGLSMSGLIHFGTGLMGAGHSLTQRSGLSGSFFTGVLAAVVASPCTAPFMGAALGFALTQPAYVCLAVFASLGLGMALPLLLLCYLPALADRLPRPGHWMDVLKHFLAFPLYLSAVWLLWVYGRQTSVSGMAALCAGAIAIAFGCWLLSLQPSGALRWINRSLLVAAWAIALVLPFNIPTKSASLAEPQGMWRPYTPELLDSARKDGRPVFVNLTADWCLTCLANERIALHTKDVERFFEAQGIRTLKGDWTNSDPEITRLLKEYGRSGVPLYLWFPAGRAGKADVLPQLLTKDILFERLK